MNKTTENIDKINILMQEFFGGKISALVAIKNWPNSEKSMNANEVLLIHELHHFYADEDIRIKDEQYALMQIESIKRIYAKLK